ncbi:hypothetical protein HK097_005167, partial [Rhizophlyctis rosea]
MIAGVVMPDSNDKSRFDVVVRGSSWSLKARSPADAKKWVWSLMESKKWMLDRSKEKGGAGTSGGVGTGSKGDVAGGEGDEDVWDAESEAETEVGAGVSKDSLGVPTSGERRGSVEGRASFSSVAEGGVVASHGSSATSIDVPGSPAVERKAAAETAEKEKEVQTTMTGDFRTLQYLLNVQMDVQQRVVEAVVSVLQEREKERIKAGGPIRKSMDSVESDKAGSLLHDVDLSNLPSLLESSAKHVQDTMGRLVSLAEGREKMWQRRWKKELESRRRWEEVVKKVVGIEGLVGQEGGKEGDGGAAGLRSSLDTLPSETGGPGERNQDLDADEFEEEEGGDDVFYDAEEAGASSAGAASTHSGFVEAAFGFDQMDEVPEDRASLDVRRTKSTKSVSATPPPATPVSIPSSSALLTTAGSEGLIISPKELERSLKGYKTPYRTKLPIDPTKPKPALAVWSFLKSAIGKDLSKVTLPVFFNEPSSMLQRMCEDIEYIELLSLAARVGCKGSLGAGKDGDGKFRGVEPARRAAEFLGIGLEALEGLEGEEASLVRVLFVGAYAMSNYSSTVGRCNKPFNPMLGETYELVREDKECRYLSEQVCHHPPISACYCDSPTYTFWTEVNVKSKFWGKSLELHPLGTCHVRLPLPSTSSSSSSSFSDIETEHYSWKKVTTAVNNLIVGKLEIDHYGDMRVRNWRTGEECVITFKPKAPGGGGWFGGGGKKSDAEDGGGGDITGVVKDAQGNVRWELKGKWDSELVAKPVGKGADRVREKLKTPQIRVWKKFAMPERAEENFNFTEFAVMMNECGDELRRVLPPTDSRLRPDQVAMERGEWELANSGKEKLEILQRKRRTRFVEEYERNGRASGPTVRD